MAEITFAQLQKKLQKFSTAVGERGVRLSTAAGSRLVRDDAKRRAKALDEASTPESIEKNIVTRKVRSPKDKVHYQIGVLGGSRDMKKYGELSGKGKANPGGDTFYWRFVEFGFAHKSGKRVPARPFMRPALENNQQQVFNEVAAQLSKFIAKQEV